MISIPPLYRLLSYLYQSPVNSNGEKFIRQCTYVCSIRGLGHPQGHPLIRGLDRQGETTARKLQDETCMSRDEESRLSKFIPCKGGGYDSL